MTSRNWWAALAGVVVCTSAVWAQAPAGASAPASQPALEPKAIDTLKKMCDLLAATKNFSVQVEECFDEVTPEGQKLQFSNARALLVRRPNMLRAESTGDSANTLFCFNGNVMWMYDKLNKVYATADIPDTLDEMLDHLMQKYRLTVPVADLLYNDPYKVLTADIKTARYIGENRVGTSKCDHLAFTQDGIDWQIWIETGAKPLPRKLVITFKQDGTHPQYHAVLSDWNLEAKAEDGQFTFTPPADAKQIEMKAAEPPPAASQPAGK